MKHKLTKSIALAIGLMVAGVSGAQAADPVSGVWQTEVDEGAYAHVRMGECGDTICGIIARTFNAQGEFKSETIGKPIVWDMQADGGGAYSSGRIWQPSTGKQYRSKMQLSGNQLKVSGCIGPICKGQTWVRVK